MSNKSDKTCNTSIRVTSGDSVRKNQVTTTPNPFKKKNKTTPSKNK